MLTGNLALLSTGKYRRASWEYTVGLKDGRTLRFQAEKTLKDTEMMRALLAASQPHVMSREEFKEWVQESRGEEN